jgi:hypothetical protein
MSAIEAIFRSISGLGRARKHFAATNIHFLHGLSYLVYSLPIIHFRS